MKSRNAETSDLLVTPERLAAELRSPAPPLLLDLRPAEQFSQGHVAGAVHLDLWGVSLIDTDEAPLRAFMWMIGHLFSLRGVTPDRPVVVYDGQSGVRAARAFWLLDYLGHPAVRLLDGGSGAWAAAGEPLTRDAATPSPSTWHGEGRTDLIVTWREVRARLGRPDTVFLDVRSDAEYYGELVRAARGGAIPGAVHVEWTESLSEETGAFKPAADLRALYAAAGVPADREVVTYCQGGYRAAHTYLALRLLGYPRVRNYVGSWKEWGDREDLPIEHVRREFR